MKKIAVVEDNPDNRLLMKALLEERYEVILFEDGPAALHAMQAYAPDLILLDISLPGMDGVELLGRLRLMTGLERTPMFALTAHAMPADRERYKNAGFGRVLAKPILDEKDLFAQIEDGLMGRA
jgi:CheY-like chemotaxis protein